MTPAGGEHPTAGASGSGSGGGGASRSGAYAPATPSTVTATASAGECTPIRAPTSRFPGDSPLPAASAPPTASAKRWSPRRAAARAPLINILNLAANNGEHRPHALRLALARCGGGRQRLALARGAAPHRAKRAPPCKARASASGKAPGTPAPGGPLLAQTRQRLAHVIHAAHVFPCNRSAATPLALCARLPRRALTRAAAVICAHSSGSGRAHPLHRDYTLRVCDLPPCTLAFSGLVAAPFFSRTFFTQGQAQARPSVFTVTV